MAVKSLKQTEKSHQIILFDWARAMIPTDPRLSMLIHIPNSGGFVAGKRSMLRVLSLKRQGLKKGFPDLALFCESCKLLADDGRVFTYPALFMEIKRLGEKARKDQMAWIAALQEHGYYATVCWGADEAIKTIKNYLGEK